jgi:Ca2+-transporting ATPase
VDRLPFVERLLTPEGQVYILATTVFHAGVVMAQIGNAFASRTLKARTRQQGIFSNPELLLAILFELIIILALIYIQPLAWLFEHLPLPPVYWLGLAMFAPIIFSLDWIRKAISRRATQPQAPPASP